MNYKLVMIIQHIAVFLNHQTQNILKNPAWSHLLALNSTTVWGFEDWFGCGWWHHSVRSVLESDLSVLDKIGGKSTTNPEV